MKKNDTPFLDRVLLHSKNADERLFDMILRFITFVILLIIVWLFADCVHAKADNLTLGSYYNIDFSKLPVSNEVSLLWRSDEYVLMMQEYTDITYNSNYHPNYITTGYTTNHQIPDDLMKDDCYMFYCYASSGLDGWYVYGIDKQLIDSHEVIYTPNGFYSASGSFTYYAGSQWGNTVYPLGASTATNMDGFHFFGNDQYCSTANCYFSNCPCYTGTNLDVNVLGEPINWQQVIDDLNSDSFVESEELFNCNYFLYDHIMKQPWVTLTETNENHMYLKDFNIGFTSANNILDSDLVMSAKWDEWVENHLSEYQMKITYYFYYNGEPYAIWENDDYRQNPVTGSYTEYVPLGKFSSYYAPEFRTITNNIGINNEQLTKIFDAFNSAGMQFEKQQTTIQDVLNGMDAQFKVQKNIAAGVQLNVGVLYNFLHPYRENSDGETLVGDRVVYMTDFNFEVNLQLVSTDGFESMTGGREWDFLNGTSGMNFDILQNNNPFSGSKFDGYANTSNVNNINNSNIAYGGNAEGGSANISNITISGGNGYQDTELHRLTDQDIAHNHQKIITVIEDLKYCFHQFAQESNHNSFIQMIYDDYDYIPGIEYITTSIIIICGVCVLIFIIKIAF